MIKYANRFIDKGIYKEGHEHYNLVEMIANLEDEVDRLRNLILPLEAPAAEGDEEEK